MPHNNSATGNHVSLLIDQLDIPDDEQQRTALLDDLETAVEEVLDDHGRDADSLRTFGGHTYTSIDADCPQCGNQLKLIEPTLDTSNGAFATASCSCGWHGDAIYRLIDLHETQSRTASDEGTPDSKNTVDILNESSSVRLHDIQPMYTPY